MEKKFRSSCPIATVLDVLGDKWTLLIIRDMLLYGKKTFKEISASNEGIATNILASRLKLLEASELITKRKLPENKKENIYLLTDKGISLAPIVWEVALWGDKNMKGMNPELISFDAFEMDKVLAIEEIQKRYREIVRQIIP